MAPIIEGDNQGISRGHINSVPRLPPKFPGNRGMLSDFDASFYGNQNSASPLGNTVHRKIHNMNSKEQPFGLNKAPEDPVVNIKRGYHRRSASDSFTYLGSSGCLYKFNNIAEEDESDCCATESSEKLGKAGSDQLTDLLDEIQHLQDQQKLPISARPQENLAICVRQQNIVSKSDSNNVEKMIAGRTFLHDSKDQSDLKSRGVNVKGESFSHESDAGSSMPIHHLEDGDDPRHGKRVLSNKQFAQRSRVRKLQYIAELEKIVNALQMNVSSLSTQILYLKHQQALLDIDNNALKQQITFYLKEKSIKDSQNETLMNDIKRLQKLCEFQMLYQQQRKKQQLQRRQPHRHASLPSDFSVQIQQYNESTANPVQLQNNHSPDSSGDLTKNIANVALNVDSNVNAMEKTKPLEGGSAFPSSSISRRSPFYAAEIDN